MPNRMIKETIHTSESLSSLTDFQFRVWANLLTYVDDFGRGDARAAIIKGTCFPLRENVTKKDISDALNALAGAGCISLYTVDERPYLCFPTWADHQRIQTKVSKFPAPPAAFHGESPSSTVNHREPPPETKPIRNQEETELETNSPRAGAREGESEIEKALYSFFVMRAEKGRACTRIEQEELLKSLQAFPERQRLQVVKQSLAHGWLGFYPLKEGQAAGEVETGASYDIDAAERRMATQVPQLKKKEQKNE